MTWGPNGSRSVTSSDYWKQPLKWNREAAKANYRPRVFCASLSDVFEDWDGPIVDHLGSRLFHDNFGYCTAANTEHVAQLDNPCTMSDLRADLFRLIDATPNLNWLLLTKRPENIRRFWSFPGMDDATESAKRAWTPHAKGGYRKNVWLGTSVSNQETADLMIPRLLACRDLSPVLFVSAEPLLGPIDLARFMWPVCWNWKGGTKDPRQMSAVELEAAKLRGDCWQKRQALVLRGSSFLDWVILGGESGPNARPCDLQWIRSGVEQCRAAGLAAFVKQLGSRPGRKLSKGEDPLSSSPWTVTGKGGDPSEWPEDLRVRELPCRADGKM